MLFDVFVGRVRSSLSRIAMKTNVIAPFVVAASCCLSAHKPSNRERKRQKKLGQRTLSADKLSSAVH
jgi:hypothetical protein